MFPGRRAGGPGRTVAPMSMYLANPDLQPTGAEIVEFLDDLPPARPVPPSSTGTGTTVHPDTDGRRHAERRPSGLPAVSDEAARPWVDPDGAPADAG